MEYCNQQIINELNKNGFPTNQESIPQGKIEDVINEVLDNWIDDILGQPQEPDETPAEDSVDEVGLPHADDLDLERIVQETIAANWGDETAAEPEIPPVEENNGPDATQFFTPPAEPEATAEPAAPAVEVPAEPPVVEKKSGVSDDTFIGQPLVSDMPAMDPDIFSDTPTPKADPVPEKEPEKPVTPRRRRTASKDPEAKETMKDKVFRYLKEIFNIPHILATAIWIALIVFIGATLGRTVWLCAEDLLALGKTPQQVTITVNVGDDMADIAQKLEDAGMIRYANLFEMFAKITGKGNRINVGEIVFDGNTIYDYNALLYTMSYDSSSLATVSVTIPEGYNCKQIFALLEESGVCSVSELEKYAANGDLGDYWFLTEVKRGGRYCLEGFLFPDTYEFYLNSDAEHAITKLLDGFEYRFSDRLKEKYEKLNVNLGLNLSLREVMTMASIVQKEKANDPEGYTIASVFYNRLRNSASYPFLNSDATANYATDVLGATTDSQINASPYNTYTQKGLPPGPICNPGLSSIDAALEPEDTGYYFFVLDKSVNSHVFSRTYDEHQRKLRELGLG
ncbi:MAG: endolytic transglycosylase MltG [Oscillospiraceae bacterium]|nr:endolytic transglycosylase MltG [Oscillospiraceae bacterium]